MTRASDTADKLDFKRILPIFVIVLVDLLGLTIIIPLLPLYAAAFGGDPLMIGALGTAYPLMQLIGGPLLGGLSDRYGRRPVLIVSQIGTFIGFIVLALANGLPLLFLARIIDGISGANIVAAQAAMTDSTTERTRAQGLGLIGAAFGLGFILGPAIAGISLAVSGNDYRIPALVAAGCSLVSILLTVFWFKETLPAERRGQQRASNNPFRAIPQALRLPLVGLLLVLMFAQQLIFGGYEALLALFNLSRLGLTGIGNTVIFIFAGVIIVLVQGKYIGPLSRKYGERRLIVVALLCLALGLTLTALTPAVTAPWYNRAAAESELLRSPNAAAEGAVSGLAVPLPPDGQNGWLGLVWLLAATVPACIGGGLLSPSINSLITRSVAGEQVGSTLGVSAALVSAANAITPLLGGTIFQVLGSTAPFLIGGLVLAALMLAAQRTLMTPAATA